MLTKIKHSIKSKLQIALESIVLLSSGISAPAALVFGKPFLAIILTAIALGVFLRFANRRNESTPTPTEAPLWVAVCSSLASVISIAALVEATNLPVRFDHSGFSYLNWLLVIAALSIAFMFFTKLIKTLLNRKSNSMELTKNSN